MRHYALICTSLLLFLCTSCTNGKEIKRKHAVHVVNEINTLAEILGPPANKLVSYFQKVNSKEYLENNYRLKPVQVDSLQQYYNDLIAAYDDAINKVNRDKAFEHFEPLKNDFLTLLNKGKEPWEKVLPVYMEIYRNGKTAMTDKDQSIITETSSIFKQSAETSLQWSTKVTTQVDEIVKEYDLELSDGAYR